MQNVHNSHFVVEWWTARQTVAFYPESGWSGVSEFSGKNVSHLSFQFWSLLSCCHPDDRPFHSEVGMNRNVPKPNNIIPLNLRMAGTELLGRRAAASPMMVNF